MARIGVPSNTKVFEAFQSLVGEKIVLPKGSFFVPFREHELVIARVEEIVSLTKEGYVDLSFVTLDHFLEGQRTVLSWILGDTFLRWFSKVCCCDISIVTADKKFSNRNSVEVFTEFYKENGRRAVLATRFPHSTFRFLWDVKNFRREGRWGEDFPASFPSIREVRGGEELSILLGRADFAVARVESGETLKRNNLCVVESMFSSYLVVARHEGFHLSEAERILHSLLK